MSEATVPAQSPLKRGLWSRIRGHQGRNLWFAAFVAPFFVGLLVFVYVPIAWSAYLSPHVEPEMRTLCPFRN